MGKRYQGKVQLFLKKIGYVRTVEIVTQVHLNCAGIVIKKINLKTKQTNKKRSDAPQTFHENVLDHHPT